MNLIWMKLEFTGLITITRNIIYKAGVRLLVFIDFILTS